MKTFFQSEAFIVAFVFLAYYLATRLQKRTGFILLNPILVAVVIIIVFLSVFNDRLRLVSRRKQAHRVFPETGGSCLGRSVVSAARKDKKTGHPDSGFATGGLCGRYCVGGADCQSNGRFKRNHLFAGAQIGYHANRHRGFESHSRHPGTNRFGGDCGWYFWSHFRVHHHEMDTREKPGGARFVDGNGCSCGRVLSRSMEISPSFGAMSSIGLIVNGIFTAILTPYILQLINIWIPL